MKYKSVPKGSFFSDFKGVVQKLPYSKWTIKELEDEKKYLEHEIDVLRNSDPLDKGITYDAIKIIEIDNELKTREVWKRMQKENR